MNGAAMASAERYWTLINAVTRQGTDLANPRISSGAVLLALRDLERLSCLAPDGRGRLLPLGGAAARAHAGLLLSMTFDRSLAEEQWIERLCLSATGAKLKRILGELTASVAFKTGAPLVGNRSLIGLVTGAREIDRSHPAVAQAAHECLDWLSSPGEMQAATLRMLKLAGALNRLSRIDGGAIASALSVHRGTASWQSCDRIVALVENAEFMGATLTGAL